jgi:flagellar hook-associated protein 3 FlgL
MIRTTDNEFIGQSVYDLQQASQRLSHTQQQISTGLSINSVEDDPVGAALALNLKTQLGNITQYQKNIADTQSWMSASDSAIGSVQAVVQKAMTLAEQGASGTMNQNDLNAIASQVGTLISQARQSMNADYNGNYLFAGTKTTTQPYPASGLTYAGDANTMQRTIGSGVSVTLNQPGFQVFSSPATGSGQNVLQLLTQVQQDLQTGNTQALSTTDTTALTTMNDQLSSARAVVGASVNQLTDQTTRLQSLQASVQSLLSNTEDADMAKTMLDYTNQQTVYQAALQSAARVIQPSLVNFL